MPQTTFRMVTLDDHDYNFWDTDFDSDGDIDAEDDILGDLLYFEYLRELYNIRELILRGTTVTHDVVANLYGLGLLTHLDLSDTGFTDAELSHLSGLPSLDLLLGTNSLSGEELGQLTSFPSLSRLSLRGNPISSIRLHNLMDLLLNLPNQESVVILEGEPIQQEDVLQIREFNSQQGRRIWYRGVKPPFITIKASYFVGMDPSSPL